MKSEAIKKYHDLLMSSFLFQNSREEIVFSILQKAKVLPFTKGEMIGRMDGHKKSLGFLLKGRVRISKNTQDKDVLLNSLGPGHVFGVASLFHDEQDYISDIAALTDCLVLFISEALLKELFVADFTISVNYITFLTERIRFLNHKIDSFTGQTSQKKVMMYLNDAIKDTQDTGLVRLPFKVKDLASNLDIARASLYRVFDRLQKDGVIARDGKTIVILDKEKLKKYL